MKRLLFITAITLILSIYDYGLLAANQINIDSLENKLKTIPDNQDKEKIKILNTLFDTYISSSPEKVKSMLYNYLN